ncbi:MAG: ABC transporter substrate-binding protein, partial [Desulfobacterales bacterium]|nr:ABC transporter substrate-binding protein [Desulfobacterales bacterium]
MKKCYLTTGIIFLVLFGFLLTTNALAVDKVVIGHPACLSGKYAKAGEQAIGGIKACIDWVNNVYGGVLIDGKRIPVKYKYYDSESKKEGVTSLIERLITVDKVNVVFSSYSSGLTLAGAPVAERYNMLYMDHGGASDRIFQQGFQYIVQTIGPGSKYHVGTLNMFNHFDPKARRVALAYEDSEFARMTM